MDNHNGSIDLLKMGIDGINVEYELICLEDDSFAELEEIDARLKELSEKIPELDKEIDRLTNHADGLDYFASVASGVVSALVDSFFVGSILGKTGWEDGWKKGWKEELAKTDNFFKKIVIWKANLKAKGFDSLSEEDKDALFKKALRILEKKYPLPSDDGRSEVEHLCSRPVLYRLVSSLRPDYGKLRFRRVDRKLVTHTEHCVRIRDRYGIETYDILYRHVIFLGYPTEGITRNNLIFLALFTRFRYSLYRIFM